MPNIKDYISWPEIFFQLNLAQKNLVFPESTCPRDFKNVYVDLVPSCAHNYFSTSISRKKFRGFIFRFFGIIFFKITSYYWFFTKYCLMLPPVIVFILKIDFVLFLMIYCSLSSFNVMIFGVKFNFFLKICDSVELWWKFANIYDAITQYY